MASITQFPRGLVSLTGLRDMGEAPRNLADTIAPTIDVTQFLLLNRETELLAANISGTGGALAFTVPPGELWYIHSLSATVSGLLATDRLQFSPGIFLSGLFFQLGETSPLFTNTGSRASCGIRNPVWAGPGTILGVWVNDYASTAGGHSTNYQAAVSKLRI